MPLVRVSNGGSDYSSVKGYGTDGTTTGTASADGYLLCLSYRFTPSSILKINGVQVSVTYSNGIVMNGHTFYGVVAPIKQGDTFVVNNGGASTSAWLIY